MAKRNLFEVVNLLPAIRRRLPAATFALLDAIILRAQQQGSPIYLVGGFVRDLLLKRPNFDLDLVVEGDAIQLGRALLKRFGGRLVPYKAFGTAVWWLPKDQAPLLRELRVAKGKDTRLPEFIDLITARRESYRYPAALPTVKFAGIREDLYRRDFTINTLAVRLDGSEAGRLLDPWSGVKDLHAKRLRTLHPASFSDDPTRILRILRFAARLNFNIEKETRIQLKAYLPVLKEVSGERIRTELELALIEKECVSILRSMQNFSVLRTIHPGLRVSNQSLRALLNLAKPIPSFWNLSDMSRSDLGLVLWLMCSSPADIPDLVDRLRLRAEVRDAILGAVKLLRLKKSLLKLPASRFVEKVEHFSDLAAYAVYLAETNSSFAKRLSLYASKLRYVHPLTDGNQLRKLGLKPGPSYKFILGRLRGARLDGEIRTAKQESSLLLSLLNEHR